MKTVENGDSSLIIPIVQHSREQVEVGGRQRAGEEVTLQVLREGELEELTMVLGERPGPEQMQSWGR